MIIVLVDVWRIHAPVLKNPVDKLAVVHALWPVVFWEAKCEYVYMHVCVHVHSLSIGNVRAAKQKPSPGFCLAGRFMQLSVLGKGWGASLDFQYFRNLLFLCFFYTSLACYKCGYLMAFCAEMCRNNTQL